MLCYAVWDSSHQVMLHRLAQLISSSATLSCAAHLMLGNTVYAAHFKLFPYCLAWLISGSAHTV